MNLPKSFFKPGTYNLTGKGKNTLKEFLKTQELSKFNDLVGYTPNPENPCPPSILSWQRRELLGLQNNSRHPIGPPWPEPCWYSKSSNNSDLAYPDPNDINPWPWPWPIGPLVMDLISERVFERINNSPLRKNTYDFIDVIKRERIVIEALSELNENLSVVQNSISTKLKRLKTEK